jgi:hypothetical protein
MQLGAIALLIAFLVSMSLGGTLWSVTLVLAAAVLSAFVSWGFAARHFKRRLVADVLAMKQHSQHHARGGCSKP